MPVSSPKTKKVRVCQGDKVWIRPDKALAIANRSLSSQNDRDWVIDLIKQEREPHTVMVHMSSRWTGNLSVMFYGITLTVKDSEIIRA